MLVSCSTEDALQRQTTFRQELHLSRKHVLSCFLWNIGLRHDHFHNTTEWPIHTWVVDGQLVPCTKSPTKSNLLAEFRGKPLQLEKFNLLKLQRIGDCGSIWKVLFHVLFGPSLSSKKHDPEIKAPNDGSVGRDWYIYLHWRVDLYGCSLHVGV